MALCTTTSLGLVARGNRKDSPGVASRPNDASLRSIAAEARRLAADGAVGEGSWSLAEVCEHLALALESTVRGSSEQGPPRRWRALSRFEQMKRWCIKQVMLVTGWFPRGVSAPASVTPSGFVSLRSALNRLDTAIADFEHKLSLSDATWGYHSVLGKMSGRAWRRFHRIHAAHHFSFFAVQ